MNSRGPVIPAKAGIQAAFAVWQSLPARTVWIPARATLGRNDVTFDRNQRHPGSRCLQEQSEFRLALRLAGMTSRSVKPLSPLG